MFSCNFLSHNFLSWNFLFMEFSSHEKCIHGTFIHEIFHHGIFFHEIFHSCNFLSWNFLSCNFLVVSFPPPSLKKKGNKTSFNSYIWENGRFGQMGREASLFIIITTGKNAGIYHHLAVIITWKYFNGGYGMNPYLNSAILFMPSITTTLSAKMDQEETILEKNQLYGLY